MFTISSVKATKPPTYTIEDTLGEPVQGTFYQKELQLSVQEIFRIEQVLKKRKTKCLSSGKDTAMRSIREYEEPTLKHECHAWQSTANYRENHPLLPQSIRGLVIGKSGFGKPTAIFNLLVQPGWLNYNHL